MARPLLAALALLCLATPAAAVEVCKVVDLQLVTQTGEFFLAGWCWERVSSAQPPVAWGCPRPRRCRRRAGCAAAAAAAAAAARVRGSTQQSSRAHRRCAVQKQTGCGSAAASESCLVLHARAVCSYVPGTGCDHCCVRAHGVQGCTREAKGMPAPQHTLSAHSRRMHVLSSIDTCTRNTRRPAAERRTWSAPVRRKSVRQLMEQRASAFGCGVEENIAKGHSALLQTCSACADKCGRRVVALAVGGGDGRREGAGVGLREQN